MINLLLCDWLVSPRARESKTVLDSGFHTVDSGFQVLDSSLCQWNLDSGFQLLVWFRIPYSLSCIPDSKVQGSGFYKQKFHGFRNPYSLTVLTWKPLHYRITFCWLSLLLVFSKMSPQLAAHAHVFLTFINQILPHVRYKSGFRDPGIFSFGIRNPENSCLLDPQSWALESAVYVKEYGIP